ELSHKSYRPVSVFTFRLNYAVHGLRPFGYHLINVLLHVVVTLLYASALRNRLTADGPTIVCSVALLVVPFLPASNLFFYVGFVIAERVLYLPSCGFCLLVAFGMLKLLRLFERKFWLTIFLKLSLTLLVGSHIAKTVLRNEDWKTEMRLFTSGLKVHPGNAKLLNNIGHVLEGEDQFEEALKYFLRATQVQPDDLGAFINVGRAYSSLGMTSKAEVYFRKAKDLLPTSVVSKNAKSGPTYARIAPSHLNLFLNLGSLLAQNRSRLSEAEALYRQAIRMRPDFVDAYMRRAEVLLKLNRSDEAEAVYRTALRFDDGNADIHYNLGVVAIENRQLHQAIEHFETAIRLHPKHPQALLNYAIVVQDAGRQELLFLAETRLKMLLSTAQDPANLERIYFHLGMIAMNSDHLSDAEHWFSSALALRTDHRSAAFNLALLFTNSGRPLKALPWLQTLLRHHPDHLKGLTLLCDLLINHSKNMNQAEACYQRLLRARPADIAARHNLCVVYVEQGRLDEAESCLLKAATLGASHQDYVDRHLAIVRLRIAKMRSAAANAKKNSSAP
ncbi:PREDICTED: transmembrane and TPR repeat-containing protein 3-like, partial [Rhagoletis zephyria]|uniref:transmembrane and TPR repeat-containing protein 3-like n=1 Tax=Rhagoletis zephyria TaxID=28612 RepID=UPI0008112E5C